MSDLHQAFILALGLITHLDAELFGIILLSLKVSLSASAIGFAIGAPLGAAVAMVPFRGRGVVVVLAHTFLGLPPVVVGLFVYLMLSRSGPLGALGWLFTPAAMIAAQTILTIPIVMSLSLRACQPLWAAYGDSLRLAGASRLRAMPTVLQMARDGLITAFLAAFGRAIAEVGAILIVGGNIQGYTRTMTTAITLETSRGDLPLALALGLVLITLSLVVSSAAVLFGRVLAR